MKQETLLHPVLSPALLAHSYLSFYLFPILTPSINHQVLVHLWYFIPGHQEKAPNHSISGRIQVLLLSSLVSQRFYFYPLSFFLPLSLFSFKEVHSKTQCSHNTPVVCHSTVHPAELFLYVVSAYSNWSANHSEQTCNTKFSCTNSTVTSQFQQKCCCY